MKKIFCLGILLAISCQMISCGDDKDEKKGGDVSVACEPGCRDNKAVACDADGNRSETDCVNGCDADGSACKLCVPECSGNKQISCDSTGKIIETPCVNGCNASSRSCKLCEAGCSDNTLVTCDDTGKIVETPCVNGCDTNGSACILCEAGCSDDVQITCDDAGKIVETSCVNGCDADGSACKLCVPGCSDGVQIACDETGKIVETPCLNGCDADGSACKLCVAGCSDDVQIACDETGKIVETPCGRGCDDTNHVCNPDTEPYQQAKTSCTKPERYCIDINTAFECSDYNNWEGGIDPYIEHCGENRICTGGVCVIKNNSKCSSDYCKDIHTLVTCKDGKETETSCDADKKCFDRACRNDTKVFPCSSPDDCNAATETCYNGFCYLKSDLALSEGDPCEWNGFREYCKDGKEYKCIEDENENHVVYVNDCGPYNGCTTVVQKVYQRDYATLNATCRGTSEELDACDKAGVVLSRCFNQDDPYFPIFMSLTSVCMIGSDGQMYYALDREQVTCGSPCDETTGYCK